MISRVVKLIYPEKYEPEGSVISVRSFSCNLSHDRARDVYFTMEKFRTEVFPGIAEADLPEKEITESPSLGGIINLHNVGEIRRRPTSVREMEEKIESGKEVLMPDGLPNVKIAKTCRGELVCFDGHHSLLAYMKAGRKKLDQVPHLTIHESSGGGLKDEEIHAFFGEHAAELKGKDWRNYTISWTKAPEEQLEEREQNDMAELLRAYGGGGLSSA